jgi:hypothetical protein
MKIKFTLGVVAGLFMATGAFAQYSQDALRFSTFQTGSTSRIKAMGNAGTAIGGDLTSVSGNPAGLGFFTRSKFSFTPEFDGSKDNSVYLGNRQSLSKNNVNLNNVAMVIYNRLATPRGADKTKGWLSVNYGIGYSRTNNYYEDFSYGGHNTANSITNYYAGQANMFGVNDPSSLSGAAYNQNLIDDYGTGTTADYRSNAYPGVNQFNITRRSGGQSEFNFSLGANYSNKLYLGLGVGVTSLRYNSLTNFNETGLASVLENNVAVDRQYNSTYTQDQVTKGEGFNAKFGVIYKATEAVRFGAVITSPTFYNIDDSYNESLATVLSSGISAHDGPTNYSLTYNLVTPFKASGGVAIFFKQYGFITGDVEYIDYSTARLKDADNYSSDFDNNNIKSLYRSAVNVHVGGEARLTSTVFLRGGYGLQGNAMKSNGSTINTATAGIGYRSGSYYIDATFAHITGSQTVFPYEVGTASPAATLSRSYNNVFVTVGFRY